MIVPDRFLKLQLEGKAAVITTNEYAPFTSHLFR